jgi:hypothetical protein
MYGRILGVITKINIDVAKFAVIAIVVIYDILIFNGTN